MRAPTVNVISGWNALLRSIFRRFTSNEKRRPNTRSPPSIRTALWIYLRFNPSPCRSRKLRAIEPAWNEPIARNIIPFGRRNARATLPSFLVTDPPPISLCGLSPLRRPFPCCPWFQVLHHRAKPGFPGQVRDLAVVDHLGFVIGLFGRFLDLRHYFLLATCAIDCSRLRTSILIDETLFPEGLSHPTTFCFCYPATRLISPRLHR